METHPTLITMPTPASLSPVARIDPSADRLVRVLAVFQLTENGRKTSLLAGGNSRAMQQVTIEVPGSRLHMVSVDPEGVARPQAAAALHARRPAAHPLKRRIAHVRHAADA